MPEATEALEHANTIHEAHEKSRSRTALLIAVLAMLLALSSLQTSITANAIVNNNIKAADAKNLAESKDIQIAMTQLAVDEYQVLQTLHQADLTPASRTLIERHLREKSDLMARLESDSEAKGKKEHTELANSYSEKSESAERQLPNFEFADSLLEIAIVLASASIVLNSSRLLYAVGLLGTLAIVLDLNGFLHFFVFPH